MITRSENRMARRRPGTAFFVVLGALILSVIYFVVTTAELANGKAQQRAQLINMTNSFVSVFDRERSPDAPVPATFRRMGIDHFSERQEQITGETTATLRMPGSPGLEIETVEIDPDLRAAISGFVAAGGGPTIRQFRLENQRLIGRTISPSVANSESCVTCHNAILEAEVYSVGDVMGAFIVENDLTEAVWRNLQFAVGAFFVALIGLGVLARREQKRMTTVVKNLHARVALEKAKLEAETKAKFLMSHDNLTGLPNRSMFNTRLRHDLSQDGRDNVMVAVVDLDDFKRINDTMGHAAGDTLLREIAGRLNEVVRPTGGLVARLGGDEFAIVTKNGPDLADPTQLGTSIMSGMVAPLHYDNRVIQPRCSVGIAQASELEIATSSDLLKAADAALYATKADGKNGFEVFDHAIRDKMWRRTQIATALPVALAAGDIRAVLQPKVDLRTGNIHGFEALARWTMDGENVAPDEFVGIAEDINVIRDLDLCILRQGAAFAVAEHRQSGFEVGLSANLSALDFRSDGLAGQIMMILHETGLSPENLTLEVTESTAVENWDPVQRELSVLRAIGVRTSLDDFGTGYSSLGYLRKMGFDEIKIDRSFITDIAEDRETLSLFESIVDMAHALGSTVVVEGIETEQQSRIVAQKGAHVGQGYYFAKPLEAADASRVFRQVMTKVA